MSCGILRNTRRFGYMALRSRSGATDGRSTTATRRAVKKDPVFSLKLTPPCPDTRYRDRVQMEIPGNQDNPEEQA